MCYNTRKEEENKMKVRRQRATIFDVAKYILHKYGEMSTWKLQKLCYYSQAWQLAWTGKPIFKERFEAWRNGPVSPELFQRHRGYFTVSKKSFKDANTDNLTEDEKETIDMILREYGDMEPYELRAQTHSEPPWKDARRNLEDWENSNTVITQEAMGSYYGEL
jgi:toxin-antitoxin system, antitoxin component, xre family